MSAKRVKVKCAVIDCPTPDFEIEIILKTPVTHTNIVNDYIIEYCPTEHRNKYYLDDF
jgi:hypothetical protein